MFLKKLWNWLNEGWSWRIFGLAFFVLVTPYIYVSMFLWNLVNEITVQFLMYYAFFAGIATMKLCHESQKYLAKGGS